MQTSGAGPPVHAEAADSARRYDRGSIARNALWRIFDSGGSELLSILFFVALGRLLVPADFGIVAIAGAFLLSCQVILRSGFGVAIIQRERLEAAHLDAAFWANVALGGVLATLLIALSAPVARALSAPPVAPVLTALAPILLLSGAAWIFHARFKREMRYDVLLWSTLASIAGGGLVGVLLALSGAGVWSLVAQQVTGALIGLMVVIACSPWRPGLRFSGAHLRDLLSFSAKVVAGHGLESASQRAIPLILAFFVTTHSVGLYVIASRLMWALASFSTFVILDLSLVVLSRLHGRIDAHREASYQTLRITTLVCLPLFVGAALVAERLIPLLLGPHWAESGRLFQILVLLGMFFALHRCAQQILISAGRPEPALRLATISAVLMPAFTLVAAPFGVVAAAIAAGSASVVLLPVAVAYLRAEIGLSTRRLIADQAPTWGAGGAMTLALWLLPGTAMHPVAILTLQILCGAAVFLGTVLLLAPAYVREVGASLRDALVRRRAAAGSEGDGSAAGPAPSEVSTYR